VLVISYVSYLLFYPSESFFSLIKVVGEFLANLDFGGESNSNWSDKNMIERLDWADGISNV
jgi:hypothetical protein